ncbi:dephospho-CoA kinase [Polynucleobacter sp. AP-Nino-20-G2]|nr:dephospho-CoA kinase [Polynucleobacter sp. AP-Nino-20-G2]QWE17606.1 dephospho-CoA kinase [Polynucleobacter sp. AP-Nino-20-G2]
MPLVGLTGGIGSGKTAVSDLLGQLGAGIIDTDLIAHQITAPGGSAIPLISERFGSEYLDSHGALDRPKMRTLVFGNAQARQTLEQITHPLIKQETAKQAFTLAKSGAPYLVFVVPLLVESRTWVDLLDFVVVVDCPEETQIERVMHRNNMARSDVENILKAQASRKERLDNANAVIQNQGSLEELRREVQDLHEKLLKIKISSPGSS